MGVQTGIRSVAMILTAVSVSACATASSPWAAHEAGRGLKEARADASSICPVVIQNGTGQLLDTRYSVVGMDFDVGLIPVGQSVRFNVQCQAGRVQAMAVSHAAGMDESQSRFAKTAHLDPLRGTRLAITPADRVR